MDIICPVCQKSMKSRALHFHLRNNHPKELEEVGYKKLKQQSKKIPKPQAQEEASQGQASSKNIKNNAENDMSAWYDETGQRMYFSPTPISNAIINQYSKTTDPSDVINKALHEFATNRGIQPAIINSQGGKALSLLGGNNEDHEFNKLLKLIAANKEVQQSYNQYSPMSQMIEVMKNKVNNGMSMGQFGKDIMQMIFMMKIMEDE